MIRGAHIVGQHRFKLWRQPNEFIVEPRRLVYVMLNPSTADGETDDPTIRKCLVFAERHQYQAIDVVNLFSYRATDPAELQRALEAAESVSPPENDQHIVEACRGADVCVAWGAKPWAAIRAHKVVRMLVDAPAARIFCLGFTKHGEPKHPLYLPNDTRLQTFVPMKS